MKKVSMVLIALIFAGCATDGLYEVGKSVYKGGELVVEKNKDLIDDKTLKSLEEIDRFATGYDTIRSEVRKTTDKKKPLLVDINSTKTE